MNLQISCTLCSKPFSCDNPPRIAKKCPHTYCESCIKTAEACPMDKIPFDYNKHGLEAFHVNRTIVKMLKLNLQTTTPPPLLSNPTTPKLESNMTSQKRLTPAKSQPAPPKCEEEKMEIRSVEADESNKCLLHNKELDLVCIDHVARVCSNCALFGQHKNHNVKPIQTLIGECAFVAEQTLAILTEIKEKEETINEESIYQEVEQCLKARREQIVKGMRSAFTKVIDKLRKQERMLVSQLDKLVETSRQEVLAKIRVQECNRKKDLWIHDAKELLRVIDSFPSHTRVEEAAAYLSPQLPEGSLIERGGYVLVELEMFDKIFEEQLSSVVSDITSQSSPTIESYLDSWFKVYRLSDKNTEERPPSVSLNFSSEKIFREKNEEDQLLEELTQFPKECEAQFNGGYGHNNSTYLNTTSSGASLHMDLLNGFSRPSQPTDSFSNIHFDSINPSQVTSRTQARTPVAQGKKTKKIKVPERYESVLQDLIADRSDCIDFTSAQIGDNAVLSLCEYICGSSKLKTLKLIRCKITDEVMVTLLDACRNSRVTSLNLAQNSLTEETLELMGRMDLGDIKSVTLSQNKINQRSSKTKIVDMKARGIVLSI